MNPLARSSSSKKRPARRVLPKRDARGRFVSKKTIKAPNPQAAQRRGTKVKREKRVVKPEWVSQLEQARLELRRAKRFTKTQVYRDLLKSEPVAKAAIKDVKKKLIRRIEKLREKVGGPSKETRQRKQERDRQYQKNRRELGATLDVMFKKRIQILGEDGADPYLDEYDVSEHVFWVEFRKRYAK